VIRGLDHARDRSASGVVDHGIAAAEKCVSRLKDIGMLELDENVRVRVGWTIVFQRQRLTIEIEFALFEEGLLRQCCWRRRIEMNAECGNVLGGRKAKARP
jgi:hypothetical protein